MVELMELPANLTVLLAVGKVRPVRCYKAIDRNGL